MLSADAQRLRKIPTLSAFRPTWSVLLPNLTASVSGRTSSRSSRGCSRCVVSGAEVNVGVANSARISCRAAQIGGCQTLVPVPKSSVAHGRPRACAGRVHAHIYSSRRRRTPPGLARMDSRAAALFCACCNICASCCIGHVRALLRSPERRPSAGHTRAAAFLTARPRRRVGRVL